MKPLRLALFIILLIFHAVLVILSLNFSETIADGIVRNPSAFRFLAFFGLAVFLVTFAFAWFDRRTARKRIEKLEAEKNAIKAEVFDREQRAQEREREVEREIQSFQASLPPRESDATTPSLAESYREESTETDPTEPYLTESHPTESRLTESHPTESRPTESRPTESRPTESHQMGLESEEDQVEYAPLKPDPDSPLATPPSDEGDSDEPDTNPFRS